MPSASTSQSGSTKLHSLNVQRHVLNGLGAAGVEWGGLTGTKSEKGLHGLSRPEGSHGLSHEVGPEEWRDWEQALWASDGVSGSRATFRPQGIRLGSRWRAIDQSVGQPWESRRGGAAAVSICKRLND